MDDLEEWVAGAVRGDAGALERVVLAMKDDVYALAIRMLWHPEDAADATREVLSRIVTRLGLFEGRSSFRTWAYRVAVRALLNIKRGRAEQPLSFEEFGNDLQDGLTSEAPPTYSEAERSVLRREVRVACTHAMLLCLDRDHRMAYLLGELLELPGAEAADCLGVCAATYRKRLSRARERVRDFTARSCGIVSTDAACRCERRIAPAVERGRIDPQALLFATHPTTDVNSEDASEVAEALEAVVDGGDIVSSLSERILGRVPVDEVRQLVSRS